MENIQEKKNIRPSKGSQQCLLKGKQREFYSYFTHIGVNSKLLFGQIFTLPKSKIVINAELGKLPCRNIQSPALLVSRIKKSLCFKQRNTAYSLTSL